MNCIRIALSTSTDTSRCSKLKSWTLHGVGVISTVPLQVNFEEFILHIVILCLIFSSKICSEIVYHFKVFFSGTSLDAQSFIAFWCVVAPTAVPRCLVTRANVETPCRKSLSWRPYGHKTMLFGEHEKAYLKNVMCMYIHKICVIICIWI